MFPTPHHSCQQAAASLGGAAESQTGSDITALSWRETTELREENRQEAKSSMADAWKEEVVCVLFSFSGCGSDIPLCGLVLETPDKNNDSVKVIYFSSHTWSSFPALILNNQQI